MTKIILLHDLAATQAFAEKLSPHLRKGDCIALYGDLGAGKTTFARALLHTLGVTDEVPSPTFTLLQTYEANGLHIAHLDLYRLKSSDELDELGWDDILADGITLVEWPEKAGTRLPTRILKITFTIENNGTRQCVVEGALASCL